MILTAPSVFGVRQIPSLCETTRDLAERTFQACAMPFEPITLRDRSSYQSPKPARSRFSSLTGVYKRRAATLALT